MSRLNEHAMNSETEHTTKASAPPASNTIAPDEAARARLQEVADQLFFIVGCGRSGTTLLQAALLANPRVTIPPETKFYEAFPARAWRYGDITRERTYRKCIERVWRDQKFRGVTTDRQRFEQLALAAPRTWDGLLLASLTAYADQRGKARVGEKSPVHTHYVGRLMNAFPNATFIHILRDPRAVLLSRLEARFNAPSIGYNLWRWKMAVEMHRRYADELGPKRYLLIRYEQLVSELEPTIKKVCELIDLPFSPEMLQPHERGERGYIDRSAHHMDNTLKPVFKSSVDRWRTQLNPAQIAMAEWELGEDMRSMGFELTGVTTFAPRMRIALSHVFAWFHQWLSRAQRATRFVLRGGRTAAEAELARQEKAEV